MVADNTFQCSMPFPLKSISLALQNLSFERILLKNASEK